MGIKFLQNIDAERNKFEEAGFEVVNQLPTDKLFAGREVLLGGRKYLYNGSRWVLQIGATGSVNGFVKGNGTIEEDRHVMFFSPYIYFEGVGVKYNWIHLFNLKPYNYGYTRCYGLYRINLRSDFEGGSIYSNFLLEFICINRSIKITVRDYVNSYNNIKFNIVLTSNGDVYVQSNIKWYSYFTIDKLLSFTPPAVTVVNTVTQSAYSFGEYPPEWGEDVIISMSQPSIVCANLNSAGTAWERIANQPYQLSDIHYATKFVRLGGTATQALMADGSTKDVSGFAASGDIPEKLPNPNPIIIKTADGVSVRYDGSTSGGVILEAGDNAELTGTQTDDDTITVKFGAVVPQKLPNPQAMTIQVLDDEGALLGSDIQYDGLTAKILKLIAGYGIELISSNLSNGQAVAINLKQIAGTTLLGNKHGGTGTPAAITMNELRSMLGSLTINSLSIMLGGNSTYVLPCYMELGGTYYQVRLSNNSLQIYRNGVWAEYGRFCQCSASGGVTLGNLTDWFAPGTLNYAFDSDVSKMLFITDIRDKGFGTKMSATWGGEKTTLNLEFVNINDTKSAWEIMKENLRSCFPEGVGKVRFAYNVAIPSGEVKTRIEMSYKGDVGVVTTTFYTEG